MGILTSVEFQREPPGKFDSRTLNRETLSRWTGRTGDGVQLRGPCAHPHTAPVWASGHIIYIYIYTHTYVYIYIYIYVCIYIYIHTFSAQVLRRVAEIGYSAEGGCSGWLAQVEQANSNQNRKQLHSVSTTPPFSECRDICGDCHFFQVKQPKMIEEYRGDLRRRRIHAKSAQKDVQILARETP